jgi:chemotaxis protein CheD
MKKPLHVIEVFLQPGDFYFGNQDTRIRTLLGSCVSITVWHPQLLIGGMCHYMLPTRSGQRRGALNGRYGDEALEMFVQELQRAGTHPREYEVKLFGGGNMFPGAKKKIYCLKRNCADPIHCACHDVSYRNQRSARQLVEKHGFTVKAENLGGTCSRNVLFDIWSGHVWVKRPPMGLDCTDREAA